MPLAVLGRATILVFGRGASAAQFLSLAIFKACPVKEGFGVTIASLARQRSVFTAAAVLALK
jgi:hypothetical protein